MVAGRNVDLACKHSLYYLACSIADIASFAVSLQLIFNARFDILAHLF